MPNIITIPKLNASVPGVSLPQIDITANPYASLENAAAKIGAALARREALDEATRVNDADAQMSGIAPTYIDEQQQGGKIAPGFAHEFLKVYEAKGKSLRDGAKTPREAKLIERSIARHRAAAYGMALRAEALGRQREYITRTQETLGAYGEVVDIDPSAFTGVKTALSELEAELPETHRPLLAPGIAAIHETYFDKLIAADPKAAHEALHSAEAAVLSNGARKALKHRAALAREAADPRAAREREHIGFIQGTHERLHSMVEQGIFHPESYRHVHEAYARDPALGRKVERLTDEARETTRIKAERNLHVAKSLAEGQTIDWDDDHLKSLDAHISAVAADVPENVAARRKTMLAIRAGAVPPAMREYILKGIKAADPGSRIAAAKMLTDLDAAQTDGKLTAWVPPDARSFANQYAALRDAGYAEAAALTRLDAAAKTGHELEQARRHHFDTTVPFDAFTQTIEAALGVKVERIVDDR
jgi:hypothetical protein